MTALVFHTCIFRSFPCSDFFTVSNHIFSHILILNRAWFESNELRIFSNEVVLTLDGLPPQFHDVKLHLDLNGKLFANRKNRVKPNSNLSTCTLDGWVNLNLKLKLPVPFSFLPGDAVSAVGNAILDNILSVMQNALLRGLVKDYSSWSNERILLKTRQEEVQAVEQGTFSEMEPANGRKKF
jgi:hypothetical protein